jgi:hypothetical protein
MKKIFTLALVFCCLFSKAQTFSWSGYSSIDHGVNDTILIPVSGLPDSITSNFGISKVCFDIYHPSKTSLLILVVAPDGHSVLLVEGHGMLQESFIGTCVGMDGVPFELGNPPYSGTFLPSGDISTLNNGQNPNGNWMLIVNNHHSDDTGSVRFSGITFTNNPPAGNGLGTDTSSVGPFVWPGLVCPGGASSCDLLPDMTASALNILQGHTETPGKLEISNATPNIGYGPMEIYGKDSCFCNGVPSPCNVACPNGEDLQHLVRQRIYRKRPGTDTLDYYDRDAGAMTFHPQHGHLHVDNWGSFTLRTATNDPDARNWPIVGTSVKQSYCLVNLGSCSGRPGECVDNNGNTLLTVPNNGFGFVTGCGLKQGIYPGLLDIYSQSLNEPIILDNICNGTYYLVSITDPENKFLESDENNNWVAVPITLTMQTGTPLITSSSPYLCGNGESMTLTASIAPTYQWSTGATTRSIVVSDTGTYTITTSCGTSAPFTVSNLPQGAAPEVSIAITGGSMPSCPGSPVNFKATGIYQGNSPTFQWKVDGVPVGTNSDTYTYVPSTNGHKVSCELISSISCFATSPVLSDSITVLVNPSDSFTTVVTQTKGYNPFCPGDTVTFTAAAVPGTNPVYHWKVDGIDAGTNSSEFTSSSLVNGQVITCTINAVPLCGRNATVGVPGGFNDDHTTSAAAYPTWYGNVRAQYLIRASELLSMGFTAGSITNLGFITGGSIGNPAILNNYTIKLATVPQASLTATMLTPTFTTVFGPVNYVPVLNDTNIHNFINPFTWDGFTNLLLDICYSNRVTGQASYINQIASPGFNCGTIYESDGNVPSACDTTRGRRFITQRPLMIFSNATSKEISSVPLTLEKLEPIYRFTGSGNWNIPANWENGKMPPQHVLHCAEIIIDPAGTGECILNTSQIVAPGAKITIVTGKKFRVIGDVLVQE